MESVTRRSSDKLTEDVIALGADRGFADELLSTLRAAGLNATQARRWIFNRQLGYPVTTSRVGSTPWRQLAASAIEDGFLDEVREAATTFGAATADERAVAMLSAADIQGVRRLTGRDDNQAEMTRRIVEIVRDQLGKPHLVPDVLRTAVPQYGRRLADVLVEGRAVEVLNDLATGRIDARRIRAEGELEFTSW